VSNVQINGGTIEVLGGVSVNANAMNGGTGTISFIGTTDQDLTGAPGGVYPNIEINKSSGSLELSGTVDVAGNWTHTAGGLTAGTSTLRFVGTSNATFINGDRTYYNVHFLKNNAGVKYIGDMRVTNELTVNQPGTSY